MATFGSLFDFPDLSDGQSELLSPPNSSDNKHSSGRLTVQNTLNFSHLTTLGTSANMRISSHPNKSITILYNYNNKLKFSKNIIK